MAKNFLVKAKQEAYADGLVEGWNKGFETGLQFMTDIYDMCLNNSDVVGKDVFGKKRLLKLREATADYVDALRPSMYGVTDSEADVVQEKMDSRLKRIWGDDYDERSVRYPYLVPCSYEGRKKK